ncbi:hypothetical protein M3A96_06890 [Helcobacillus massiliensis]|uniref:hypothetical protein n=1 Tax=Helcobacillus massiliensis TaxID=521392 RepID=UPI0021A50A19|nr:hypothetical protein [Helcobacillus massiliensis]MCT1557840.1 hypothetical protein [Helcobacillus massiliensis]MCT2036664.1 hypothetical protein [Helcobacillus massiliensis]MCT2332135.1 hypothetical protein [Helcobacillus massiliensis]
MAQLAAHTYAVRPRRTAARPRLALIARPRQERSIVPFAALITLILVATLAAMLVLNVSMTQTSYEITRLQEQDIALSQQVQALREENEMRSKPQELEKRARDLGMVPVQDVAFVDLANGRVVGDPKPAQPAAPGAADKQLIPPADLPRAVPERGASQPLYDYGMGNEGRD